METKFKVGDLVQLTDEVWNSPGTARSDNRVARVENLLDDIKGGLRLDRPVGGIKYWNENDLERAELPVMSASEVLFEAKKTKTPGRLVERFGNGEELREYYLPNGYKAKIRAHCDVHFFVKD